MQLFFSDNISDNLVVLNEDETRHLKVLRKQKGDDLQVIDGKGNEYACRLLSLGKDKAELEILNLVHHPKNKQVLIHLFIAPTKNSERIEWMLEKAVEVGLDAVTFIETEHSEKNRIRLDRLERIAVSAMKQSGQFYLPAIHPLTDLNNIELNGLVLLAHCNEGEKSSIKEVLTDRLKHGTVNVLIGPEGDFSISEVNALISKGAVPIHLGNTRLRTETAGLYSVISISSLS
ncbi:MAG TPA: RsmE family RNA methyltransferase [Bacteroidia bacterium]